MTAVLLSLQGRKLQDAIEQSLRGAIAGTPGRRRALSVWLSGTLARPFLFGPVRGLNGWAEAQQAAQGAASQACGIEGPCRVVLEGDPAERAVIATAVQQEAIESIYRLAAQLRVRIKSIRPAWAEAIDAAPAALRGASVMVCRDADSLTLLGLRDGRYDLASTYAPRPAAVEMDRLMQRLWLAREQPPNAAAEALIGVAASGVPTISWSAPQPVAA